jgi:hypothetical protein
MKDGALVTCRVLWSLMGVVVKSEQESAPHMPTVRPNFREFEKQGRPPGRLPVGVTVRSFSESEFDALPSSEDVVMVLVAANKCVAHLDENPDHGVSERVLDCVIETTISEVCARVF